MKRSVCLAPLAVLCLIVGVPVSAQGPDPGDAVSLFTQFTPDISGQPPAGIDGLVDITIDLPALEQAPWWIRIQLTQTREILVALRYFEAIEGFDVNGHPLPGMGTEDLRYTWRGQGEGFDVVISVVHGWVSGSVIGAEDHYKIQQTLFTTQLEDLGELPIEEEPPLEPAPALNSPPEAEDLIPYREMTPADSPLTVELVDERLRRKSALSDQVRLDVLVFFTEQARIDAGGDPTDPSHVDPILAVVDESYMQGNQAFENSDVNVRIEVVAVFRVLSFELTGTARGDLFKVKDDPLIAQLRRDHDADLVSFIVPHYESDPSVNYCGFAFAQRKQCWDGAPIPGCDIGPKFYDFAYHVVSEGCAARRLAWIHELIHGLGCEHARMELSAPLEWAALPSAYAFVNEALDYKTIGSIDSRAERLLYVSNPFVFYDGNPTGELGVSYCARAIEALVLHLAALEPPIPGITFADDFETGDTSVWEILPEN